jgi:hypothetical protein
MTVFRVLVLGLIARGAAARENIFMNKESIRCVAFKYICCSGIDCGPYEKGLLKDLLYDYEQGSRY